MIPPEESSPPTTSGITISNIFLNQSSQTSVEISVYTDQMTLVPDSISVYYIQIDPTDGSAIGSASSPILYPYSSDGTSVFKLEVVNLLAAKSYSFYVKAVKGTGYGNELYKNITLASTVTTGKVTTSIGDPKTSYTSKAYLVVDAPIDKNKFEVLTRQFNAIQLPTPTSVSSQGASFPDTYYTFGTSLFLEPNFDKPNQGAGIGFFSNDEGSQGYFVLLESTALAASKNRKTVRIVKANGTELFPLKSSGINTSSTFDGLYGGVQYNLDIKVKLSGSRIDISVYINGHKLSVYDQNAINPLNQILYPTNRISVIATSGKAMFDYVYGSKIEKEEYDNFEYTGNFYQGQFSNDLLTTNYGNLVYENSDKQDLYTSRQNMVDEFGTTVREILKASVKFDSRPAFPIRWTTGGNKFAKIISSKYSNFGGEAYVLNNASTTIPLSDNNLASFYIYGNTLSSSGQLEYIVEMDDTTYNTKEPILFQSKWIQSESDAKSIGEWIKNNVVNKGKIVNMEVFGNPLIAVGDIVAINYSYNGFTGQERFIVTNVSQSFDEGLTTEISCRLI